MSINGEGDDEATAGPPTLAQSMANEITEGNKKYKSLYPSALIYRVPVDLRNQNKSAYTPCLIAIGPLHRDNPELPKTMQHIKMNYADYLFFRLSKGREDKERDVIKYEALETCVEKMKDCVDKAKKYYAEEVKLTDFEMMEMLLVDGCFILELLYSYHDNNYKSNAEASNSCGEGKPMADPTQPTTSANSWTANSSGCGGGQQIDPIFDIISNGKIIKRDLLLLENQIPFFVLEELFKLTVEKIATRPHNYSLPSYILFYFGDIMSLEGESSDSKTKPCCTCTCGDWLTITLGSSSNKSSTNSVLINFGEQKIYHILHLLHFNYLPQNKRQGSPISSELKVSASDLDYAGVKFVPGTGNNLFNVNFNNDKGPSWWSASAKFEIPTLSIHGPTGPFFRNLIALEQCCPGVSRYFTSYAKFMDLLINSEKDVKVLTKAKVINNCLSADYDVVDLFNNLCKEVVIGEFYFNDTYKRASKYSDRLWPQFMAYLRRTYFASPWKFIGFCLALIAFGMQITQTVYVVK